MPLAALRRHAPFLAAALLVAASPADVRADLSFAWRNPLPQGNPLEGVDALDASTAWAVGARGTCLVTHDGGAAWTDLTDFDAFDADLRDVAVLDAATLVAAGEAPGIFRSTDAGASWAAVANPSTGTLRDVEVVAGPILSAVGDEGQTLRSTDAGLTWAAHPTGQTGTVHAQHWFDASHGLVVGLAMAARTTDGGGTWTPVPGLAEAAFFDPHNDVAFPTSLTGFVVSDFSTWKTTDGGASWTQTWSIPVSPIYQRRVVALSESRRFVVTSAEGAEIWETTDGGASWTNHVSQGSTVGYQDVVRLPDGALLVVSVDGDLLRGDDDGQTWTNATRSPGDGDRSFVAAIERLPSGRMFAGCGIQGASQVTRWLRSDDGGAAWTEPAQKPGCAFVTAIDFHDENLGLVSGFGPGHLWRTTDGGGTWTAQVPPASGIASDVCFADAANAFATYVTESNGLLLRSTDGGVGWSVVPSVGAERMECVDFPAADVGYAGGGSHAVARLYRTTDGGATWAQQPATGLGWKLDAMHWLDETTGLVGNFVGAGGIYRTTDGGQTFAQVASGGVDAIEFHGPGRGIAAGYSSGVRLSSDAGLTWTPLPLPWTGPAQAVSAHAGGYFVGGPGTVILEVLDSQAVAAHPLGDAAAGSEDGPSLRALRTGDGFVLRFALREPGLAALEIHDVRGARVARLFAGPAPREGSVAWDGKVASGVYFARLTTGRGAASARLVVVR
jgi:photosystem II stability/assembly factor-like uncharacterized protein